MRELCGSRTDACSGISPGPLCPRNLQGGRTIQAHWSIKWNDDVGKLNVIWFPRHNNNNNNKYTIPTNWHRLVTYSGCVFVESQGVGGQLLSATGETIKEPLPADLTLTSWFSEEEQERFRFPRVTLMNVAWRQNDTHTAERHTVLIPQVFDEATWRILFIHEKALHQPAEGTAAMYYNTIWSNITQGKWFEKCWETMTDQHLLRFAYCAVSQTDNLHLLLCVVLLLVQFGDAANVTSHFFLYVCV